MKHSGVMAMNPGSFNPYKIGIELFRDIEDRWNKGKFGREWTECTDIKEKNNWDKKLNLGMEKIFEVRKLYNDTGFIDEFLTEEFCVKHKFFVQKFNQETQKWEVDSTDFPAIKKQLLFMLTNFGQPIIWVENSNFQNRGELLLKHLHEGQDLQKEFMEQTLSNLFKIWKRPVSILTKIKDQDLVFRYDGITGLESITTET
jgi:stage V sporulation protein R